MSVLVGDKLKLKFMWKLNYAQLYGTLIVAENEVHVFFVEKKT